MATRKKSIKELGAAAMAQAKGGATTKKTVKKVTRRKKAAKKTGVRRKKASKKRTVKRPSCDLSLAELKHAASVVRKAKTIIKEVDSAVSLSRKR